MERFTATGRPLKEQTDGEKAAFAYGMVASGEVGGSAGVAPNFLPVKFTDESLIPVAVIPPDQVGKNVGPEESKKKRFWQSRRASRNSDFIIKQIPRGEYLKYYAKDDDGVYIGTEDPAKDCMLKGADVARYRGVREAEKREQQHPAPERVRCMCHSSPCEHTEAAQT
jgi:hypothetical protein